MLTFPQIDAVALELGPLKVHWYGLMYLMGFASAWGLAMLRRKRLGWSEEQIGDMIFYGAMGVILGGRLGYVFFYGFDRFLGDPIWLFKVWDGGMSFHGGLLGVLAAMALFARKQGLSLFQQMDFLAPLVPPGLFFGRVGNFINGELWGRRVVDESYPFGMMFPHVDQLTRHPSQLYEAGLEGLLLFIVLWWYSRAPRPVMAVSGLFLAGYGSARFTVEFFREPDVGQPLFFDWMSKGQLLSTPMIAAGLALIAFAYFRARHEPRHASVS